MRLRHTCETPNVNRLLNAVLTVNSAPFRGYPAETLILRGVDCSDGSTGKRTVDFRVERCDDCDPYARTDFNSIPELAAAELVGKPLPPLSLTADTAAMEAGFASAAAAVERFGEACRMFVDEHLENATMLSDADSLDQLQITIRPGYAVWDGERWVHVVPCPDCRGTGEYRGLASVDPCRTCGGRGTT